MHCVHDQRLERNLAAYDPLRASSGDPPAGSDVPSVRIDLRRQIGHRDARVVEDRSAEDCAPSSALQPERLRRRQCDMRHAHAVNQRLGLGKVERATERNEQRRRTRRLELDRSFEREFRIHQRIGQHEFSVGQTDSLPVGAR